MRGRETEIGTLRVESLLVRPPSGSRNRLHRLHREQCSGPHSQAGVRRRFPRLRHRPLLQGVCPSPVLPLPPSFPRLSFLTDTYTGEGALSPPHFASLQVELPSYSHFSPCDLLSCILLLLLTGVRMSSRLCLLMRPSVSTGGTFSFPTPWLEQ